jgi:hypothetical protein
MSQRILIAGDAEDFAPVFSENAKAAGYTPLVLAQEGIDYGDGEAVLDLLRRQPAVAAIYSARNPAGLEESVVWESQFHKVLKFFKALEFGGVRNLVYISSASVYGNMMGDVTESHALSPTTPCGMAKLACEVALQGLMSRVEASDAFIDSFSRQALQLSPVYPEFRHSFFPCLKSVVLRRFENVGAAGMSTALLKSLEHLLKNGGNDVFNMAAGAAESAKISEKLGWQASA